MTREVIYLDGEERYYAELIPRSIMDEAQEWANQGHKVQIFVEDELGRAIWDFKPKRWSTKSVGLYEDMEREEAGCKRRRATAP